MSSEQPNLPEGQFRATKLWQEVIKAFREGMPRERKRSRWRSYEDCFSGGDALQWLLEHLKTSNLFGTVNRTQVEKLLNKFVQNEVIVDIKKKDSGFSESTYYRFVTEPRALNFVDDTPRPKGGAASSEAGTEEGLCIVNEYAFAQCSLRSFARAEGDLGQTDLTYEEPRGPGNMTPDLAEGVWKEAALARLLQIVELSTLDGVFCKPVEAHLVGTRGSQQKSDKDIPRWVLLAIKCVAEWPEGCTEEFVGGLPVYHGLEMDVLNSLVVYFSLQAEPLISNNLCDLLTATLRLLKEKKGNSLLALQLCLLLLPRVNRARLHLLLKFICNAAQNNNLILSTSRTNFDELLELFSHVVLHVNKGKLSEGDVHYLMTYMVQHYQCIFKVPDNIKHDAELRLSSLTSGQGAAATMQSAYCHRVTQEEYDQQKNMSDQFLVGLLAKIVDDKDMPAKLKKKRLQQFEKSYPQLYRQYHSTPNLSSPDPSDINICTSQLALR